ncbi:MAG TPA: hypothetical protein VJU61_13530 [Polyangiaceae bacterium]|nr:hypothetical protein [Polyangiaceae bacterium]
MGAILDVAIGLIFLYLLLALVATTVQELVASVLRLRAKNLYDALEGMLKGEVELGAGGTAKKRIIQALYEHPLIRNLCRTAPQFQDGKLVSRRALPSYIPSRTFALALLDVLRGDTAAAQAVGAREVLLKAGGTLDRITNNDDLRRNLKLLLADAAVPLDKLDEAAAHASRCVETLFNDRMARASGWYKRQAQGIALLISMLLAGLANADTLYIADRLWTDDALRSAVVQGAGNYQRAQAPEAAPGAGATVEVAAAAAKFGQSVRALESAGFPIGWSRSIGGGLGFFSMLLGWLITAFAVSLGSNFWFDVLSKALQIRGGGPKVSAVTGRVGEP